MSGADVKAGGPPASWGSLILVVGPSGAGKDTLIQAARNRFRKDDRFLFPERIITRPADDHEPHKVTSEEEFNRLQEQGAFLLAWGAHGNRYAIPAQVLDALAAKRNVVVNVSRTVIEEACARYPRVRVINVTAGPNVLRERLLARGREDGEAVQKRVERASSVTLPACAQADVIDNSGPFAQSFDRFSALLNDYASSGNRSSSLKRSPAAG